MADEKTKQGLLANIRQLVHDCLTGPDGKTYAFGRVASVLLLVAYHMGLTGIGLFLMYTNKTASLAEWCGFIAAIGGTLPILVGAITALVRLTNNIEPQEAIEIVSHAFGDARSSVTPTTSRSQAPDTIAEGDQPPG